MTGWLVVAGLGPGNAGLITPEVSLALDQATDVIGYFPYVARVSNPPNAPSQRQLQCVQCVAKRHPFLREAEKYAPDAQNLSLLPPDLSSSAYPSNGHKH